MATLAELRGYVRDGLDDNDILDATIDRYINQAVRKVSSLVLLKILEASDTVTTNPASQLVDLPATFGHNLFAAAYADARIRIMPNMTLMLDKYPLLGSVLESGYPGYCCQNGAKLALSASPSVATDITLFFHTWPVAMSAETDTPDLYLPHDDQQEDIIANYCWWRMHRTIEDSLESPRANTAYHRQAFADAVREFDREMSRSGMKSARPRPPKGGWMV